MAFNPQTFVQEYQKRISANVSPGFNPLEFVRKNYPVTKRGGFDTSQDLYNLAVQSGLQSQADKILASKGEETKKIFAGGVVSDIFDTLNLLQYGVVGMLKGKGFVEGVRTRQSWSDKDALGDNGIPGIIGGIALDIACDPLTYIAPWTILKKAGVLKKLEPITEVAKASKVGKWLGNKFVYRFGQDPVYKELGERAIKNITVGDVNIKKLVEGVIDIPKEKAAQLLTKDKTGRFIRKPLEALKGVLTDDELFNVSKSYAILDDLGKQAVDLKLLGKGTWETNLGEYIKNAYLEYEQKKPLGIWGWMKKGVKGIKKRKPGLTPEKMAELGQIENPSYLLFKSMVDLNHDIENAKLFKVTAEKFGLKAIKEGFKQLPDTKRLGDLANKFVPESIFNDIQEITRARSAAEKGWGKVVAGFKFGKVIMNPATHARNVMSNEVLNWWKLGLGPWRQDIYLDAATQMAKGGKYIDEAKTVGYGLNTFASQEIKNILLGPDSLTAFGKARGKIGQITEKLANIYQGEENLAKLAAFIFKRKGGIGIEDAWKAAESATFNYAQVTPFIRKLRTSLFGFPFITFTVKATPIAVETALKAPQRISAFGKIKNAIENASDIEVTARERASEPAWIKDGFYVKLPMKDKYGRSAYFDLTYIMPFGDIVSGQLFERGVRRETGLPESIPTALMRKTPFFNLVKELATNQDFYGDKIWKEGDDTSKQLGDIMRHLTRTYSPPVVSELGDLTGIMPGGYMKTGERRIKGIRGALTPAEQVKQQRTLMQELLRNVGLKVQPIDVDIQESYAEWERKKAMESLLEEAGVLKQFRTMYVPKK